MTAVRSPADAGAGPRTDPSADARVDAVRRFNRFYTQRIGALRRRLYGSPRRRSARSTSRTRRGIASPATSLSVRPRCGVLEPPGVVAMVICARRRGRTHGGQLTITRPGARHLRRSTVPRRRRPRHCWRRCRRRRNHNPPPHRRDAARRFAGDGRCTFSGRIARRHGLGRCMPRPPVRPGIRLG
jgi:hypothetical protein